MPWHNSCLCKRDGGGKYGPHLPSAGSRGQGNARVSPGLVPGVEDSGDRRAEQQAQQVGDARGAVTHDELA